MTPAAPFLVSVPLTDPDNQDNWIYDVHVYPKNSIAGAEKTVTDAPDVKLGDRSTSPSPVTSPQRSRHRWLQDRGRPRSQVELRGATATLVDGTVITEGTDYNVVFDAATNTVSIVFTPRRPGSTGRTRGHQRSGRGEHHGQHHR